MDTTNGSAPESNLKVLPVDGSQLTYRVAGDGPPVLLASHIRQGRILSDSAVKRSP